MNLSTAQINLLNRPYLAGGQWNSDGYTVNASTLRSLVALGLVTFTRRRKFNEIGTAPGGYVTYVYTITITAEGCREATTAACVKRSRETLAADIAEWGCE